MPERIKIIPPKNIGWNEESRLRVGAELLKAGFTVRIDKEKKDNKTVYFVEFWEEK